MPANRIALSRHPARCHGPVILHLERINTEFEFGGIYLFRFNDDHSLQSIARAENSGIDDSDQWVLENVRETRFLDDGVQAVQASVAVETFDLNSELLGITLVQPVSLSARGLLSYIGYLIAQASIAPISETTAPFVMPCSLSCLLRLSMTSSPG